MQSNVILYQIKFDNPVESVLGHLTCRTIRLLSINFTLTYSFSLIFLFFPVKLIFVVFVS